MSAVAIFTFHTCLGSSVKSCRMNIIIILYALNVSITLSIILLSRDAHPLLLYSPPSSNIITGSPFFPAGISLFMKSSDPVPSCGLSFVSAISPSPCFLFIISPRCVPIVVFPVLLLPSIIMNTGFFSFLRMISLSIFFSTSSMASNGVPFGYRLGFIVLLLRSFLVGLFCHGVFSCLSLSVLCCIGSCL